MFLALIPAVLAHWKTAVFGLVAFALGALVLVARHEHAHVIAAEQAAAAAQLQAATTAADAAANQAALTHSLAEERARSAVTANIRSRVHAQPSSPSCATSAPMRSLLDGLRADSGASHSSAGAAVAPAVRR